MSNIYGDRVDAQGRPADDNLPTCHRAVRWYSPDTGKCEHPDHDETGDASPIDGRTASEALRRFAKVRVTYTVEVRISPEEYAGLDTADDLTEVGVIHRALDQIRENPGKDREEEVVDIYID